MRVSYHLFPQSDQLYLACLDRVAEIGYLQIKASVEYAGRLQIPMDDLTLKDGLVSFDDLLDIHHCFLLIKLAFFFDLLGQGAKLTVLRNDEYLLVP